MKLVMLDMKIIGESCMALLRKQGDWPV